jgi:Tol biopolymer transport system component
MNGDGGSPRQLTGDMTGRAYLSYTTATPDGRYILFVSDVTGVRHIWRMEIDGDNLVQLTNGSGEDHPEISPDGQWVVYTRMERGELDRPTLWKVSIDGGEPIKLNDEFAAHPAVSPDGKLVAALYSPGANSKWTMAVFPFEGGQALKTFPTVVHGTPYIRWTPDSQGLTFVDNTPGASRIWVQPLDGGPPRKIVEFDTDRIFGFDWSRDGKALASVRGFWALDAVLIRDFIKASDQ